MKKIYVLDTNVLINSPHAPLSFEDNSVVIPGIVIEELDRKKTTIGDVGYSAREACRVIEAMREKGDLVDGVETPGGGVLRVDDKSHIDLLPEDWTIEDRKKPDNKILATAIYWREKALSEDTRLILVSMDVNMRIKANILGLKAELFKRDSATDESQAYEGRRDVMLPTDMINLFYQNKSLKKEDGDRVAELLESLSPNGYVCMVDECDLKHSALGRFDGKKIIPLISDITPYDISPRNNGQRFALDALLAPPEEIPLVILKGTAGTAKTMLALASGLDGVTEEKRYRKVIVTRANQKMDEDIGYLKGTLEDKMRPLLGGIFDNLEQILAGENDEYTIDLIDEVMDRGYLEIECLAYVRGRTLSKVFLIVDEVQNTTPHQIKTIITRAAAGTKVVLCGDPWQIDNPRITKNTSGIEVAWDKWRSSPMCAQVLFKESECERSELSKEAAIRME